MALVALLGGTLVAYWAGLRVQRYLQARADVRDARTKLRKARGARSTLRRSAVWGGAVLGAVLVLAAAVLLASLQDV